MLKVVIFDLDGTLYDYEVCHIKAMNKVADYVEQKFKINRNNFDGLFETTKVEVKKQLVNSASSHNRIIYFKHFLQKLNVNPFVYADILYDLYWKTMLDNMKLFDGVIELFEFLKYKKIKIAVCTNLTTNIQLKKIRQLNVHEHIDYLITSEEVGREKPDKAMFLDVLEYFKITPQETLFIGDDFKCDILGAKQVGIDGILLSKNIKYDNCRNVNKFADILQEFNKML